MNTITKSAIDNHQLKEYLGGYPGFEFPNPYADASTYPAAVLAPLKNLICKEASFRIKLVDALLELSHDSVYGWMAMYYIRPLRSLQNECKAGILSN